MISSLLPKPKHAAHDTIRVVLPRLKSASKALLPVSASASVSQAEHHTELAEYDPDQYSKAVAQVSGIESQAQTSYEDTIPLKVRYPNLKHYFPRYTLQNCPDDSLAECLEETREFINSLLAKAEGTEEKNDGPTVVELHTQGLGDEDRGRTVEIRNYQEDPMLPPKFKLRKNRHKNPSPPPPILKAAGGEKISKEIKDKWRIPSAVSNWKNNQGFAISLGKRMIAASGGSLTKDASINIEKFGKLSLALEQADKQAREEISIRNEQRKKEALRQQEEKQQQLQTLLDRSRLDSKRPASKTYNARKRSRK